MFHNSNKRRKVSEPEEQVSPRASRVGGRRMQSPPPESPSLDDFGSTCFTSSKTSQRCYGKLAESSGVKRFQSIARGSSPLDPLRWPAGPNRTVGSEAYVSSGDRLQPPTSEHLKGMQSGLDLPLSSLPPSPFTRKSPAPSSSALSSPPPSSLFDEDSPPKSIWTSHGPNTSPATSPSSRTMEEDLRPTKTDEGSPSPRPSTRLSSHSQPELHGSFLGERLQRRSRRAPNREPVMIHQQNQPQTRKEATTAADQAGARLPTVSSENPWDVWVSVSPPPACLRRRNRPLLSNDAMLTGSSRTADPLIEAGGAGRDRTPTMSSESQLAILATTQSRPDPPANFPGRSKTYAKQQMEKAPKLLKVDGTVEDCGLREEQATVDALDEEAEEEDADDVVYELLRGHARKKPKRRIWKGGLDDDEVDAFFNSPSISSKAGRSKKRSCGAAGFARHAYNLTAKELPLKSFYARAKREEKSPTPEIRAVQRRQWTVGQALRSKKGVVQHQRPAIRV